MGKVALLVIDVQNEYFAPLGKWVLPGGDEALVRIRALLDAHRRAGLPVFHIVHESLDPASPVFRPGTPAVGIHPAIDPRPGERRILKHFPGSFTQTPLEAYLRLSGADTVVICGFMTHMCCDTTTRQARERGFRVWFASDATATRHLRLADRVVPHHVVHETTLAVMAEFAEVLTSEAIVGRLGTS